MRNLLLSLLVLLCSCTTEPTMYKLTHDKIYEKSVQVFPGAIAMPVHYVLPDSVYIQEGYSISDEDGYTIHKGDTLLRPGDTVHAYRDEYRYEVRLEVRDNEFYMISDKMLSTAQINLNYKTYCISSKTFRYPVDRNNMSLDFYKMEDDKYIYKAPFTTWVSGHFDELNYMLIMYYEKGKKMDQYDEIYLSKADISHLMPSFEAYLSLE